MYIFDIENRNWKVYGEANDKIIGNKISPRRENNIKTEETKSSHRIKDSRVEQTPREIIKQCARENMYFHRERRASYFRDDTTRSIIRVQCIRKIFATTNP